LERPLPAKIASSTALVVLQGELSPDLDEEIAVAVSEARKRVLRERDQHDVRATNVEVINEDVKATPTWSFTRRWKFTIAIFVLFVIGTIVTFAIVFSPSTIQDEPTATPSTIQDEPTATLTAPPTTAATMSRFSILGDVIGSSFEDDFPSTALQEETLNWLVYEDPAYLPVDTKPTTL
jgi:hypothetical protein